MEEVGSSVIEAMKSIAEEVEEVIAEIVRDRTSHSTRVVAIQTKPNAAARNPVLRWKPQAESPKSKS